MSIYDGIEELNRRKRQAALMGAPERIESIHRHGGYSARERVEKVLDPGTFFELGQPAHSDIPGMEGKTPADGKICGFGEIDGRTVLVRANDVSVLAGSGGGMSRRLMANWPTTF